tara:strand:+ start:11826 stop:12524 length:699 start_codon:yes stop_codon:yes gene_type:complete
MKKEEAVTYLVEGIKNPPSIIQDAAKRSQFAIDTGLGYSLCGCGDHAGDSLTELAGIAVQDSKLYDSEIHGVIHWLGVYHNALLIANGAQLHRITTSEVDIYNTQKGELPADVDAALVAMLFSLFHDSRRDTKGHCTLHGAYGNAALIEAAKDLAIEGIELEIALLACSLHTIVDYPRRCIYIMEHPYGDLIGMCLDADRMDLMRLGTPLDPRFVMFEDSLELQKNWLKINS